MSIPLGTKHRPARALRSSAAMYQDSRDIIETTLLARQRTLVELTARVARVTAELSDDEVVRLLHSILEARARARADGRPAPS